MRAGETGIMMDRLNVPVFVGSPMCSERHSRTGRSAGCVTSPVALLTPQSPGAPPTEVAEYFPARAMVSS